MKELRKEMKLLHKTFFQKEFLFAVFWAEVTIKILINLLNYTLIYINRVLNYYNLMNKKNPNLTAEQKLVMFEDGTEPPGTSVLNNEKREGSYHCANCGIKLFDSNSKYESGSGWPSFYQSLPDVFETKTDHLLGYARTEYHCKNCGGHHGHIFEDGPQPTGKRYCNNGICLVFKQKD